MAAPEVWILVSAVEGGWDAERALDAGSRALSGARWQAGNELAPAEEPQLVSNHCCRCARRGSSSGGRALPRCCARQTCIFFGIPHREHLYAEHDVRPGEGLAAPLEGVPAFKSTLDEPGTCVLAPLPAPSPCLPSAAVAANSASPIFRASFSACCREIISSRCHLRRGQQKHAVSVGHFAAPDGTSIAQQQQEQNTFGH
eukprot:scaffold32973_cov31-Tisochrysis_lutea.AAC.5